MKLPKEVKILDVVYKVEYVDNVSEVDIFKRKSLFGQIDFWTRTIRIYDGNRSENDIMQTVWHEVLHALCEKLDLEVAEKGKLNDNERIVDLLGTGINLVLVDNPEFIRVYSSKGKK